MRRVKRGLYRAPAKAAFFGICDSGFEFGVSIDRKMRFTHVIFIPLE